MPDEKVPNESRNRVSRRTVLKLTGAGAAIAWTTPIISSVRMPAFAASAAGGGVPYGSCDWRYMQVPAGGGAGFESGSEPAGFASGCAGFGNNAGCSLVAVTNWDENTDMLLRRTITLPSGVSSVSIGVAIDNDVTVYWDGVMLAPGTFFHGGCATQDSIVYTAPNTAGDHLLAVRGHDYGIVTYLDVAVTVT